MSGFCWHCGTKLRYPHFEKVTDPLGHVHRVHKRCKADATFTQVTAQPRDDVPSKEDA